MRLAGISGALLLGLVAWGGCGEEPAPTRAWRVEQGFIRDAEGRALVMRGINLSGEHKTKPYLGFHTRADFLRVREAWGMNALRFVITWAAIEPERDRLDEELLRKLEERLEWASEAGLLVVLDMHQDVYGEGFGGDGAPRWTCDERFYAAHKPVSPWFANYASPSVMTCFDRLYVAGEARDRFVAIWRKLAARLARFPSIVGFDVLNEPHWGSATVWSFERERLQPFYERVVAAVREVAPHWLAFLEPASSRNLSIPTSLEPFAGRGIEDVVYAPHSYDAIAEGSGGFDPARRGPLQENLAALAREANLLGAALWIGEYGGVASEPGIVAYMDASYDGAAAVAASTMYWDYTRGGYGVLDKDGAEQKSLLDTLVRPYPERIAGTPESYGFEEAERRFSLVLRPDPKLAGLATELALPARVYPGGALVSCGGCRVEESPGRVRLFGLAGERATVTVTPRP